MRKLATVRRVAELVPIEGADKIHVAKIDGWQVVTQKDWCQVGDLVCYFEIDSFLPVRPEYEFLRKSGFKSTKNLGDGFRLRTIKLRKELSQGLIMPIEEVLAGARAAGADLDGFEMDLEEGQDLTDILGVQLYEKPIPTQLAGRVRGNFPMDIRKTDQERAQNLVKYIRKAMEQDDFFEITLKLDGSSMTVYNKGDYQGVCSRNWDLDANEDNDQKTAFWKVALEEDLVGIVAKMKEESGIDYALQGELMGPGVQYNREKLDKLGFYLFDIWDITNQCYISPPGRRHYAKKYGIKHVPVIGECNINLVTTPDDIIGSLQSYCALQKSLNTEVIPEGLVFKSLVKPFSFKIINNEYLLKEKDE